MFHREMATTLLGTRVLPTRSSASPACFFLDQHLYRFYRKDVDEGKVTGLMAKALLEAFWLKFNDQIDGPDQSEPSEAEGVTGDPKVNPKDPKVCVTWAPILSTSTLCSWRLKLSFRPLSYP